MFREETVWIAVYLMREGGRNFLIFIRKEEVDQKLKKLLSRAMEARIPKLGVPRPVTGSQPGTVVNE